MAEHFRTVSDILKFNQPVVYAVLKAYASEQPLIYGGRRYGKSKLLALVAGTELQREPVSGNLAAAL